MLKKAGMVAGIAAGLMVVAAPAAMAGTPDHDLVLGDRQDAQVTHYFPIQVTDNHVPVSSEEYVDGGMQANSSHILGHRGGDVQETDVLPIQVAGNTIPLSSFLDYTGGQSANSSSINH